MNNLKPNITFLGVGLMGAPMVNLLLNAGYNLTIWNRSVAKLKPLLAKGAVLADSPASAVRDADIVITMLYNGQIVDDLLFGQNVAISMATGSLLIDMSSIAPLLAQEHSQKLQALNIDYLDAPVSGGTKGAEEGSLVIMAGGNQSAFSRAASVLDVLGRGMLIGPTGSGQLSKLANQTIVGITIAAVSEGLLLASAGGADVALVRECLLGGFADSRILKEHGLRMVEQNFTPGGSNEIFIKDLKTVLDTADQLKLDLPILKYVLEVYVKMVDDGQGDLDHASYILSLEKANTPHKLIK